MERTQNFLQALRTRRGRVLIYSFLAVAIVFLLATGLTGLELLPGDLSVLGGVVDALEPGGGAIPVNDNIMKVVRIIYIVGLVLFPVWIVYMIVNPKARKRFLRDLLFFGTFVLFILLITSRISENQREQEDQPFGQFGAPADFGLSEEGSFDPNAAPPESAVWIASLVVALVIVIILVLAVWLIWRSRRREESAVERIALEVQTALDDLNAGADFRNVVVRCYSEMVQALKKEKNIQRSGNLTPREFEDALDSLGFPIKPVHELTRLFETVRYGRKEITKREELMAVDSLSAILDACRSQA